MTSSTPSVSPTPYRDVNTLLQDFLARIQAILKEKLVGFYLYGSLSYGNACVHPFRSHVQQRIIQAVAVGD